MLQLSVKLSSISETEKDGVVAASSYAEQGEKRKKERPSTAASCFNTHLTIDR